MRANYRRFIAVAGCIACSIPVHGAGQTNYPTVEMPSGYTESFHPDTRPIENQTQAAYLLVLLNLVDPTEGVEPEEMAPPEHLEEIGLGRELFDLVGQKSQPQSYARLADRLGLESPGSRACRTSSSSDSGNLPERSPSIPTGCVSPSSR